MSHSHQHPGPAPWLYLFGVVAWTWTFFGMAILTGRPWLEFPAVILIAAGGLGPVFVSGLLIRNGRWDERLDSSATAFFKRSFDPRTLAWRWHFAILGLLLVLHFAPPWLFENPSQEPRGLIVPGPLHYLLVGFVFGALEEPGWRGYAQEALQKRLSVMAAGFVIGIFWAAWHLPLFLLDGTYQSELGIGTPGFWAFHGAILISSPLYAWLYNMTGRVIFSAVLFHALGNVAGELASAAPPAASLGVAAVVTLLAIAASWRWMRVPTR